MGEIWILLCLLSHLGNGLALCLFEDLENKEPFPRTREINNHTVMFFSCVLLNLCFLRSKHCYMQSSHGKFVMDGRKFLS